MAKVETKIELTKKILQDREKAPDESPYLFNTLAQLATPSLLDALQRSKETLKKRAGAKYITGAIIHELTKVDSPLYKSYRNTYNCASVIVQNGQELTSEYCNNRWCLVCNRIRTARLINGYMPALKKMQHPVFLTLTIPNVEAEELRDAIGQMTRTFSTIIHRHAALHDKINGIRKTECTYNPIKRNYHPHIHAIIDGWNNAQVIREKWLKMYPNAVKVAQDIRPCKDDNSMIELFKYFTKIMTNKDEFYPVEMDVIFRAMRKKRVYQPFGNIHPVEEEIEEIQAEEYQDILYDHRIWQWLESDWIDRETGECLSGYEVDERTRKLQERIAEPLKDVQKNAPCESVANYNHIRLP